MDPSSAPNNPKQLGDFELRRELGRGGMGVVYEANEKSLNRRVALKVLSTGGGLTTKAITRFKREAEAAAKLHHTNIVPIYSIGEEDRVPYYAMELIDGPSLDQVIRQMRCGSLTPKRGSLDSTTDASDEEQNSLPDWVTRTIGFERPDSESRPRQVSDSKSTSSLGAGSSYFDTVAEMMAGVADALAHAHAHGVIHRDIKPANLLLSQDGRLSVNDFGLARMLEQPGMTVSGELMGSPMYMSPEQIAVGRVPLDHRTDIYSLGAALYELLTLKPPFDGQQRDQVLSQIIHKEPSRPGNINSQVPKDLETICLKAMDKDPDRRYQTADQMADDLRRFVNRHAISAQRIGPVGLAIRWTRRHRALTFAIASALLLGTVALTFAMVAYHGRLESIAREEALRRGQAMDNALAAAMSGDLRRAKQEISEAELHGASVAWIEMLQGQVASVEGRQEDAIEHLKLALELEPDSIVARAMLTHAYIQDSQWIPYLHHINLLADVEANSHESRLFLALAQMWVDPQEAERLLNEAIKERRSAICLGTRATALAYRAIDSDRMDLLASAQKDASAAIALLPDNPYSNRSQLFTRLVASSMYAARGESEKAEQLKRQCYDNVKLLAQYPKFANGKFLRANLHRMEGDFDAAAKVYVGADEIVADPGIGSNVIAANAFHTQSYLEALNTLDRIPTPRSVITELARLLLILELPDGAARAESEWHRLWRQNAWDGSAPRCFSVLWLCGNQEQAKQRAEQSLESLSASRFNRFPRELLKFQAGLIEEHELIQAAGASQTNVARAHHIIAVVKLSAGDRQGARDHFERSASGPFWWGEVLWSKTWLSRIDDPMWLPWLPSKVEDE